MNLQRLKELAQRVNYQDFSVNHSGYGVVSSDGTFADCLGIDEATFIYAANPSVVLALIGKLEVAERERDEMKGSLKAAVVNAETWMKRALKAERERDEFRALAEEQSELAGRNAARAQKAEAEEEKQQIVEEYDAAMCASNEAGYAGITAADTIRYLIQRAEAAEEDIERRDAAAGEPVGYLFTSSEGHVVFSPCPWAVEWLTLQGPVYAAAAETAVLPPDWYFQLTFEIPGLDNMTPYQAHGAAWKQCRERAKSLGAQPQKVVELPSAWWVKFGKEQILAYPKDVILSLLDAANVQYEVKK